MIRNSRFLTNNRIIIIITKDNWFRRPKDNKIKGQTKSIISFFSKIPNIISTAIMHLIFRINHKNSLYNRHISKITIIIITLNSFLIQIKVRVRRLKIII